MKPLRRLLATLLLAAAPLTTAAALPDFAAVRAAYRPSEAWLLDRSGQPLQRLRVDARVRRLEWTPIEQVSPALLRALLLAEDRDFYRHAGVDWGAAAASAWRNLWSARTRGASTLSMQLVGLLDAARPAAGQRDLLDKLGQAGDALALERRWRKDEILEAYLNLVSFRGELQGVAAMSQALFGKSPEGLDDQEGAIAAALLRAPQAAPKAVAERACGVLKAAEELLKRPAADCRGLPERAAAALAGPYRIATPPALDLAPHLARRLLHEPGERLRSTLSLPVQRAAGAALRRHLSALARQGASDGAVLVVDNASGEILAWVGSSGAGLSRAAQVDGVSALRQPGSTLKPFLYQLAVEQRRLTAATLVDDSPLAVATGGGVYAPENYVEAYRGWVSVRAALAGSLNVPAVRTLMELGPEAFHARLHALGFASLTESGGYYGYSLALGSAEVSLLMLANAYRSLANGGRWSPLTALPGGTPARPPCRDGGCAGVFEGAGRQAAEPAAGFIIADILADRVARAATFGLDSVLATSYWSAVKTGTSKDMRDNWCVGFSRRYTVAVWVGNAAGAPMQDVSGVSGAAPVWREVMDLLEEGRGQSRPPAAPAGLEMRQIRFEPALEAPRREWFLKGSGRDVVRRADNRGLARIDYPGAGSVLALDADIPPLRQKLRLRLTAPAAAGWRWVMDGQPLARADRPVDWLPSPGRHTLVLLDAAGQEADRVSFEVRSLQGRR